MAAGDLTDLASVRALIGVKTANDDTILQQLISAMSAYVPRALNRGSILTASYAELRVGNGQSRMRLRNDPVQTVSLIEWQGTALSTQADIINGTSGIATDGLSAFLVNYTFPLGAPVRITYTAGWATAPLDIQNAVAELVAEAYARKSHTGETSHSQGGQTTVAFDQKAMHAAIADKLKQYMRVAPI